MVKEKNKPAGPIQEASAPKGRGAALRWAVCLVWVTLGAFGFHSLGQAARIAGEEGVKPAAPEVVKPPAKPPAKKPTPAVPPRQVPPKRPPVRTVEKPPPRKEPPRPPAPAPEKPVRAEPEKRYVTIDFDNVDIALFIKFISELTGKNFVIDKAVKGKVTIISPTKISVDEAYKVFESVLEVHGFATVPSGEVTKIVPAIAARSKSIETLLREEAFDSEDKIVTQLIPLRYANPDELKKLFAPLISKSSVIVSYPPTGMLIVTDMLSNINRLMNIVKVIDVVGIGEEITVVPLEYATATVLVKSLTTVFLPKTRTKKGISATPIKVVADERMNAVIIAASESDTVKVKALINILDKEVPRGEGDIRVYYLQNANAEDLAKVLTALPTDDKKAPKKGKAPVISKEVQIVADKATNSLVITSNRDDYRILEEVIRKLDIPRRMVYLEALMMEVDVNKSFELGVQWLFADDIGSYEGRNVVGFAGSTPPSGDFLPSLETPGQLAGPAGFTLGIVGEALEINGITFPSIGAVVRAFQTDSDIQILSNPQLMTMDNEEAEVVIAENIPYLTRQDTTDAGLNYSNYEFKDVGVTLKITPQINQERYVRLEIFQKIEQVVDQEEIGLPSTLKRETQTTVMIKDGHTIVIAGLIDETLTTGNYQVPCLGRIPVLSWLFKTAADTGRKTNLYFFVTPRIIENPQEAQVVYEEKKEAIDTQKENVIRLYDRPGITQERIKEDKERFLERSHEVLEEAREPDESDVPIE